MNTIATVVGVSLLLVFCEACHYKHKTCTEFAALGDDFTVTFGRLDGCCRRGLQSIAGATIKSANTSEKPLPHNSTNFWVHFAAENTTHGSHWYTLTYNYICDFPMDACLLNCSCRQQDIKLHLRIAAFHLRKNVLVGENIEFLSSSGLSTNNVKVNFYFSLAENLAKKKSAPCEPNMRKPKHFGNWKVFRSNTTNDCCLVVENATLNDSGYYEAVGVLPGRDGNGKHIFASSNFVVLRVEAESSLVPEKDKSKIYIFIGAIIGTLVLIVIVLFVIVFIVYRHRPDRYRPGYVPVPDEEPVYYGAIDRPPIHGPNPPPIPEVEEHRNISPYLSAASTSDGSTGSVIDTPIHSITPSTDGSADPQARPGLGGGSNPPIPLPPPIAAVRSPPPPVLRTSLIAGRAGEGFTSEEDRPESVETVIWFGERTPILSPQPIETGSAYREEIGGDPTQPLNPQPLPTITETPDVSSTGMLSESERTSPVNSEHNTSSGDNDHQSPNDRTSLKSYKTGQRTPDSSLSSGATGQPSDTSSSRSSESNGSTSPVSSEHSSGAE